MSLPPITRNAAGQILAGGYLLEPSHHLYRKRLAWWRARDRATGRILTGWHFTPLMALRTAATKSPNL